VVVEFLNRRRGETKGGTRANSRVSTANHRRRREPTECASGLEHPLNAGVHFFFLDELAACDLVDSDLHLLLKPLVVGKQPGDRFLHQIVGASPSLEGKLVELGFLILRQRYFHDDNLRITRAGVRIPVPTCPEIDGQMLSTQPTIRAHGR